MEKEIPKNKVYVGKKPFLNYVTAVNTLFQKGFKEIIICARGTFIHKAVDVAEVIKNNFSKDEVLLDVKTGTESFKEKDKIIKVSTIDLKLTKHKTISL